MLFHYKAISFNFQSIFSSFYNFLFSLSSFLSLNFSFLLFFADLFLIFFQRFFHTPSGLCFTFIILTMLRMRTVCLSPNRARKQKESVSAYASIASTLSYYFLHWLVLVSHSISFTHLFHTVIWKIIGTFFAYHLIRFSFCPYRSKADVPKLYPTDYLWMSFLQSHMNI